jgi:hypothetical protein
MRPTLFRNLPRLKTLKHRLLPILASYCERSTGRNKHRLAYKWDTKRSKETGLKKFKCSLRVLERVWSCFKVIFLSGLASSADHRGELFSQSHLEFLLISSIDIFIFQVLLPPQNLRIWILS